jgi:fumarylacetoacetase
LLPSRKLDFEVEVGAFISQGNAMGRAIALAEAERHVFGVVLLNDWSARDIQAWEYQPLGPFLAKNFATTISPWIVTLDALAPFRSPMTRPAGDPQPLPYLDGARNRASGGVDIQLEVHVRTAAMRAAGVGSVRLGGSNYRDAYWSIAQLVAHHTVNGCNLRSGDLLGSGTMSGAHEGEEGSLLELSHGGRRPLSLPNGETRTFLEDGDQVMLLGYCERAGYRRIGFGECTGTVVPALEGDG